jgi:hypothetical protein
MILLTLAALLAFSPQTVPQIESREISENSIHIKYPEVANATQFNAGVRQILDPVVEAFRNGMPKPADPDYAGYTGSLDGRYTANILKTGVVSVLLEWSVYVPGAAHPGGFMASINYDTRAGRVLVLSDLFRPGVKYVSRLSQMAIASLERQDFADSFAVRHGAGPVENNFKVFTLTDTSLVFHFPTYQVAAGAAGPQEVVIPLDTLARILRKP